MGSLNYGFGKDFRIKFIGDFAKGIFAANQDSGAKAKRDVIGMLISHVCDLLIHWADAFISYVSSRMENEYGSGVFEGAESIYAGIKIKRQRYLMN